MMFIKTTVSSISAKSSQETVCDNYAAETVQNHQEQGSKKTLKKHLDSTELLVIQASPFCNLDCSYCYLPDRANPDRMKDTDLPLLVKNIFSHLKFSKSLSIVWHAGEPLVVPLEFYQRAISSFERYRPAPLVIQHHFQTNAVLINHSWCKFFKQNNCRVGVSLDGPDFLHDACRKTRTGKGTFEKVMKGVNCLKANNIQFHVICVLTKRSLQYPDEIFDFFVDLGTDYLCFNMEEIEGINLQSSLNAPEIEEQYKAFFGRIIERLAEAPDRMRVREIDNVLSALSAQSFGTLSGNSQNIPGKIVSIAKDGGVSTYCPELLGQSHPTYGSFLLGNILKENFIPVAGDDNYSLLEKEIESGVQKCKEECKYFDFCLGGAPANKLAENETCDSTETMFCRLSKKIIIDSVLEHLDQELPMAD